MKIDWTKNLNTQEEKERFEKELRNSPVLQRLAELLSEYEKSLDRSELTEQVYDRPNWAERQAHKNGYRACLTKMRELVDVSSKIQTL